MEESSLELVMVMEQDWSQVLVLFHMLPTLQLTIPTLISMLTARERPRLSPRPIQLHKLLLDRQMEESSLELVMVMEQDWSQVLVLFHMLPTLPLIIPTLISIPLARERPNLTPLSKLLTERLPEVLSLLLTMVMEVDSSLPPLLLTTPLPTYLLPTLLFMLPSLLSTPLPTPATPLPIIMVKLVVLLFTFGSSRQ